MSGQRLIVVNDFLAQHLYADVAGMAAVSFCSALDLFDQVPSGFGLVLSSTACSSSMV